MVRKNPQCPYNLFFGEQFDEQQEMVDKKIRPLKEGLDFIPFNSVSIASIFAFGWLEAQSRLSLKESKQLKQYVVCNILINKEMKNKIVCYFKKEKY